MSKTAAIDFDGVIHKFSEGWRDGSLYDEPVDGAIKHLNLLVRKGYKIIVFTTRTNFEEIKRWIFRQGFKGDIEVTNIKPKEAFIFIDDRGYRFTNWQDVYKLFP